MRLALALVLAGLLVTPASAARFGEGAPAFAVYPAPEDMPNNNNAGEPTIGVNWKTGRVLYQAFSSTYAITFDDATTPAGVAWEDAENPTGSLNLDPILFTDPITGRTWGGGLQGPCGNLAFTDTDGAPWTKVKPCSGTVDHEAIGAGPFTATPPNGASYPHGVYYCAQFPIADACARSVDGGATFGSPVPVTGCEGLHGHVKVAPDGTVYLPSNRCLATGEGSGLGVGAGVSTDNGDSWSSVHIPAADPPRRGFDPSIGITGDNVVYEAWNRAGDFHPMVARSLDRGASWERVTDLSTTVGPALAASTFLSVIGGSPGRVAVAYLGTSDGPPDATTTPFDTGYTGAWYLYVSVTYDGGAHWTTTRATDDPVQRGCIWDQGGVSDCRNLLDFMDVQVTKEGRVVVGFADGCVLECALPEGTTTQSISAHATIARQSTGRGLFETYDASAGTPATPSPAAKNRRPKACFLLRAVKLRVRVDARCSTDRDGVVKRFVWSWGDGKRSRGAVTGHRYKRKGRYKIRLTVTDDRGARAVRVKPAKVPRKAPTKRPEFGEEDGH